MEEEGAVVICNRAVVIWQISMCVKNYGRASKAAADSTVSFLFCFLIILLSALSDRKKRKERNIIKLHGTSICAIAVDHSC